MSSQTDQMDTKEEKAKASRNGSSKNGLSKNGSSQGVKLSEPVKVPEVESLDKVREILFGDSISGLKDKFSSVEDNILRKLDQVVADQTKRVQDLESRFNSRFDELEKSINSEKGERIDSLEELGASLVDARTLFKSEIMQLGSSHDDTNLALRKELNTQTDKVDRLSETLDKKISRLSEDKTDSAKLASILGDLAQSLTKNSK